MEVVGIVLGAIPLVIAALQSYKDTRKIGSRFLKREKYVGRLIRALREQHGLLQTNLDCLFKSIGEPDYDIEAGSYFEDAAIRTKMVEYLGAQGFDSFEMALRGAQQSIERIARSIQDFLPERQRIEDTLEAVFKTHSAEDNGFKFRRSWKLLMKEENVEEEIKELQESIKRLDRLQNMGVSMRQMETSSSLRTSKKLAVSLYQIQKYARHLYKALSDGWSPGCHSSHEARLVLEDRVERAATASRPLDFSVIFLFENIPVCDFLSHEIRVRIIAENLDEESKTLSIKKGLASRPPVTFSLVSESDSPHPLTEEVKNVCVTICEAAREKKTLEFYLPLQQRLHFCHPSNSDDAAVSTPCARTVSLRALLTKSASTSDRSKKLPLRPRLFLALILASTLIQLNTTPWLTSCWSKESIHFSCPSQTMDPSQIDLKRPLLTREFHNPPSDMGMPQHQPEPREMILELGIMLLELGLETTLEEHFSGTDYIISNEYHTRLSLAARWLDESEPYLAPTYFDVTVRCVRCHFDGIPYMAVWDEALVRALTQYVIDPLQEQCRPKQRI
ncbi:hypothetical protein MMC07_003823 [Pseudocyphellaria aurata]|nr:hypothetical protein [Pseudocyphellaria aurata]